MKAAPTNAYVSSEFKASFITKSSSSLDNMLTEDGERYLLSFFDIFKNRNSGEKIFSYLHRMGIIKKNDNGTFFFVPKAKSAILPIVCLYKTLNEKGYLKRMTQTEAGYYFCKAFGKGKTSIRMFYFDQLESSKRYDDYFFHIPEHSAFAR